MARPNQRMNLKTGGRKLFVLTALASLKQKQNFLCGNSSRHPILPQCGTNTRSVFILTNKKQLKEVFTWLISTYKTDYNKKFTPPPSLPNQVRLFQPVFT